MTEWHAPCMAKLKLRLANLIRDDRGDVPGWVLITLMTARPRDHHLGSRRPALSSVFQQAIDRVVGF